MEKSLEMRVWLKVNFSVLRELEYKKTQCFGMSHCDLDCWLDVACTVKC